MALTGSGSIRVKRAILAANWAAVLATVLKITAAVVFSGGSAVVMADNPFAALQEYQAIRVEAEDLPEAASMPIDSLSLAAVVEGRLEPVPFQIDEYNIGGGVYFEHWDVPIDGKRDVFDAHDKLLFLNRDAGPRRTSDMVYDGKILAEIHLSDASQPDRYVYLVKDSRLRSDTQYVRYSSKEALLETDFFSMKFDQKNLLNWNQFEYNGFQGKAPLDSLKIRFNTGVVTNVTSTEMDNNNFVAHPVGDRVGPIRTVSQWNVDFIFAGVSLMQASIQLHVYPKSMVYDCRIVIPSVRRSFLVNPQMSIMVDGNNLMGAKVRMSASPNVAVVDGRISPEEEKMRNTLVDPEHNWIWMHTGKQFDTVWFYDDLGGPLESVRFSYEDNATQPQPPERFPGQLPGVGHTILQFPTSGFYGFAGSFYFEPGFGNLSPEVFTAALRNQPDIEVTSMVPVTSH